LASASAAYTESTAARIESRTAAAASRARVGAERGHGHRHEDQQQAKQAEVAHGRTPVLGFRLGWGGSIITDGALHASRLPVSLKLCPIFQCQEPSELLWCKPLGFGQKGGVQELVVFPEAVMAGPRREIDRTQFRRHNLNLALIRLAPHHDTKYPAAPHAKEASMPGSAPVPSAAVTSTIRIGVSACLLGQEVRYDGGHSHEPFLTGTLAGICELVPVCPETELGMGVPRETVDLVGSIAAPRMVATHTRIDWTAPMKRWSGQRARQLAALDLCGYVFKRNSPSCGVFRVKVHPERGRVQRRGRGLFAAEFARRFPLVPLEEEVRLQNPRIRDNFIVRIFALQRLQAAFGGRWRPAAIAAFHGRETALLQAHDAAGCRQLDQMVAAVKSIPRAVFRKRYQAAYMNILARNATPHRNARVLRHLATLVRAELPTGEYHTLQTTIADFQQGQLPLLVPITLLRDTGSRNCRPRLT